MCITTSSNTLSIHGEVVGAIDQKLLFSVRPIPRPNNILKIMVWLCEFIAMSLGLAVLHVMGANTIIYICGVMPARLGISVSTSQILR